MAEKVHRSTPYPEAAISSQQVLADTQPNEPMSVAAAERRIAEIMAHVTNISRQLDDRSAQRKKPWASDPNAAWRRAATAARTELRQEEKALRLWIDRQEAPLRSRRKALHAREEIERQELVKSTRDARRLAQKSGEAGLWDLYLKIEIALLEVISAHGLTFVGPLGQSLLYSAQMLVPEWYRTQWLKTTYDTTWGRQAEAQRGIAGSGGSGETG